MSSFPHVDTRLRMWLLIPSMVILWSLHYSSLCLPCCSYYTNSLGSLGEWPFNQYSIANTSPSIQVQCWDNICTWGWLWFHNPLLDRIKLRSLRRHQWTRVDRHRHTDGQTVALLLLLLALLPSLSLLCSCLPSSTLLCPRLQLGDHLCHIKHHVFTWEWKNTTILIVQRKAERISQS